MTNQIKSVSIIGDSFTKGIIYDEEHKVYKVLKENYCNLIKDNGIIVNNYSICGINNSNIKDYCKSILKKVNDKLVIMELGFDLFDPKSLQKVNPKTFKRKIIKGIRYLQKHNIEVILVSVPLLYVDKCYEYLQKIKYDISKEKLFNTNKQLINYNNEVQHFCAINNLNYLDLNKQEIDKNLYAADGRYLSKYGHQQLKNMVSEFVNNTSI